MLPVFSLIPVLWGWKILYLLSQRRDQGISYCHCIFILSLGELKNMERGLLLAYLDDKKIWVNLALVLLSFGSHTTGCLAEWVTCCSVSRLRYMYGHSPALTKRLSLKFLYLCWQSYTGQAGHIVVGQAGTPGCFHGSRPLLFVTLLTSAYTCSLRNMLVFHHYEANTD